MAHPIQSNHVVRKLLTNEMTMEDEMKRTQFELLKDLLSVRMSMRREKERFKEIKKEDRLYRGFWYS